MSPRVGARHAKDGEPSSSGLFSACFLPICALAGPYSPNSLYSSLCPAHILPHRSVYPLFFYNTAQLTAPIESHTTTVTNSSANSYRISTRVIHSATTLSHPRRRRALSFRARSRDEHILPTSFQPTTASSLTGPYTSCSQIPPSSSQPIPSRYNTCN